jgi:hypothetical protein
MGILFPRPTKILRSSAGEYVDGIWQEPERTEIAIKADVQSYSPSETKQAPLGWQQGMSAIVIYTAEDLIVANAENKNSGDVVVWMNKCFRVMTKEPKPYLLPHNKYLGLEETSIIKENV